MKLTMTRVLTPLAALAFAFSAQAALPANEGFEGAQLDASWTFVPGTDNAPDASAITAYGDDAKPADSLVGTDLPGLPDGFTSDGDNYLKLSTEDGTLFRKVNGDDGMSAGAGLYLDTVVQFTVTDQGDRPTPSTELGEEDKFIIWLDAGVDSTNLCVYGGEYDLSETTIGLARSKVYTLSADDVEIEPGTWHRLTVKAVSNMGLDATGSQYTVGEIPAFQVYVDGVLLKPVESMLADSGLSEAFKNWETIGTAGFVPAMVPGGMLSKVGFSGEGKLDDVVITTQMPGVEPHDTVTFTWESEKVASITPYANGTALGTFTASPATINVPVGATITLAAEEMGAVQGYNSSYFAFGESEVADVAEGGKSLSYEFGEAGESVEIALDIEYTLAYDVTVDWNSLVLDDVVGITIGDVTISGDGLYEGSYEVKGLAPGAFFSVTVAYVPGSPLQTIYDLTSDPDGGLTINGSTITIPVDYMESGDVSLTVSLSAEEPATPLFKIGDTQYTLDELAEAMTKGMIETSKAQPLTLLDDVELEEGLTIAAGSEQWLDLAGKKLTGPAEGSLFTVAGTLNIVDSDVGGAVEAGTIASVAATGVLNLTAGDYTGDFDLTEDGVIYITGGTFDADVEGATFPVGYGLVYDEGDEVFEYAIKTYTIKYYLNEGSGTAPADTTFTVESAGTIAGGDDLTAPAGKTFGGWNTQTDGEGTDYAAGAATPEVTADLPDTIPLYAKWVDAATPLKPGEQDTTEYETEKEAQDAAAGITIAAAKEVADALTADGALAAYLGKFEKKVVEKDGKYCVEVALTAAAVEELQTKANDGAAAVLDDTATGITTTPGFYYSLKQGGTLDVMAEGKRVLATGSALSFEALGLDKSGNAGFYKVLVNITAE